MDSAHWSKDEAATLIDALAAALPICHLPEDAVHAHTRHYMPAPSRKTLVFDAFAHLPEGAAVVVARRKNRLDADLQRILWADFGGELQFALGWAATPAEARAELERRKRQPGRSVLQPRGSWEPVGDGIGMR